MAQDCPSDSQRQAVANPKGRFAFPFGGWKRVEIALWGSTPQVLSWLPKAE
jgi:hypothetical protein